MRQTLSLNVGFACCLAIIVFGSAVFGQSGDPEILSGQLEEPSQPDSASVVDSAMVQPGSSADYGPFYSGAPWGPDKFAGVAHSIKLGGSNSRMYRSVGDALRPITSFYSLEFGPFGQEYGVTFLGLPPYMCKLSPDPAGSYQTYRFPPAGLTDLRLVGLEQGEELLVKLNDPLRPTASVTLCSTPQNEPDAETEVSVFKGGHSFANTDVRFGQLVSQRFGWDFNVGIEKNDGDLLSSAKRRENYSLNLHYKLTPKWQLSSRIRFLRYDDEVAQFGRWSGLADTRDGFLRVIELDALSADSNADFSRAFVSYQTYEEKVRGRNLYIAQQHGSLSGGADFVRNIRSSAVYILPRLVFNRVTFEPGYDYYTRVSIDGGVDLFAESSVACLLIGRYLYDWGDASRLGYGARVRFDVRDDLSAIVSGDVFHVPPTDMARFLKPQGFDADRGGIPEYNHGGDRTLQPTEVQSVSGSFEFERNGCELAVVAKAGRIDDMVIWQRHEGAVGGLYQAEECDAELTALIASSDVSPLKNLEIVSGYTFARLLRTDDRTDVSLMPRHNLYASIGLKQHIGSLQLDVFPNIEAEYHSTSYSNQFKGADLDGYVAVHGRFCVKIKSFTFYYSMENVFNRQYRTVDGYDSYRRVWWGFRWIFIN